MRKWHCRKGGIKKLSSKLVFISSPLMDFTDISLTLILLDSGWI